MPNPTNFQEQEKRSGEVILQTVFFSIFFGGGISRDLMCFYLIQVERSTAVRDRTASTLWSEQTWALSRLQIRLICSALPDATPCAPLTPWRTSDSHLFIVDLLSASCSSGRPDRASFASAYVIHRRSRLCFSGQLSSSWRTVAS
jgi:hypothetical protein